MGLPWPMAFLNEPIVWGIKEHIFNLILSDVMLYDQLFDDVREPDEIIDVH